MNRDWVNSKYEILDKFDSGGMSTVCKVKDFATDTILALKTSSAKHIQKEFLTLSKLNHPNIIKVYDFSTTYLSNQQSNQYFFTMEYIEGKNFYDLFKDNPPRTKTDYQLFYSIILQICSALKYIHFYKLIHCDIKPNNILIELSKIREPRAIITDFGLIEKQTTKKLKGTLQYIAPEVLKGENFNQSIDLFSLGVTLYQILTHCLPFKGDNTLTLIKQHTKGNIKSPKEFNPTVPEKLNNLILELLQVKPQKRTKSINDVQETISQITGEHPLPTLFTPIFTGRQKEFSILKNIWQEVKAGNGRVISIYGENGIGKTRILQEFKSYAQIEGAKVKEFDSGKDILETFTDIIDQKPFTELNLFDEIVNKLINEAKQSPLLFIVKDLQFQKNSALNLIEYLIRSIETAPIFLIITSPDTVFINKNIQSIGYFNHLNLTSLSLHDTTIIVKSILLIKDKIENIGNLIHNHTGGNPFLIITFTQSLVKDKILEKINKKWSLSHNKLKTYKIPKGIEDFITYTLKKLSEDEFNLLKTGAILKNNFTCLILKDLIQVKPHTLHNLQKKGLIIESQGKNLSFTHQMLSNVIEKNIPLKEKILLHKKIAKALKHRFQQDFERIAPDLTYHYLQTNEDTKVYKFALISGERAKNISANTEAIKYFELALSLIDKSGKKRERFTLYETLGNLYHILGKYQDALIKYEFALSLITKDSSVRIYRKIGIIHSDQQNYDKALNYFQKGLKIPHEDNHQKTLLLSDIGWVYMCCGDFEKALFYSQKAIEIAEKHNDQLGLNYVHSTLGAVYLQKENYKKASQYYKKVLIIALRMHNNNLIKSTLYNLGQILWKTGKPKEAEKFYQKGLKIDEKHSDVYGIALYYRALGILAQEQNDFDTALKYYNSALTIFKRIGDNRMIAHVCMELGVAHKERGNLNKAIQDYETALSISHQLEDKLLTTRIYNYLGNLYKKAGDFKKAISNLKKSLKITEYTKNIEIIPYLYYNIGETFMLQNKLEEASKFLHKSFHLFQKQKSKKGIAEICSTLAEYYLLTNNLSTAESYCVKGIKLCKKINLTLSLGILQRIIGTVYSRKGEIDKALVSYSKSIKILENLKVTDELGKTLLVAGEEIFSIREKVGKKFWREGLLEQILTRLKQAEEIFKNLNADTYLKRVNFLILEIEKYSPLLLEPIPGKDKRLKALYRMTQIINSTIEVNELLKKILDITIEIMEAERGFILLREGNNLVVKIARNMDKQSIKDMSDFSMTIVEDVEKKGERIITSSAQEDPRFKDRKSITKLRLLSILCVPFRIKDRTVGAIYIDNRRKSNAFTSEDLEFLRAFCNQAAISLENAVLMQQIRNDHKLLKLENIDMKDEITHLRTAVEERYNFGNLIGKSKPMQEVYNTLERVIKYSSPVIIEGETGTGKELAANITHYSSSRKDKNFVIVNSSAIPENLLESEIFGHIKGAFTGAIQDKKGLFEIADGGTIFFDEIGEMSPNIQAKLLRVLQDGEFRRVGATKSKKIDVRVVVATHRNLQEQIKQEKFREDLYYRLNVLSIKMPPLRERKEDIPFLATYILRKLRKKLHKNITGFTSEALYLLQDYSWPGNVRELENVIERTIIMSEGKKITQKDLPISLIQEKPINGKDTGKKIIRSLADAERETIHAALKSTSGNKRKTIKILGVSRPTLDKKLKKYNL